MTSILDNVHDYHHCQHHKNNMIFYSRKHKKNKTLLQSASNSFSLLQAPTHHSKPSLKKINMNLLSTSKEFSNLVSLERGIQIQKPRVILQNFMRRGTSSQLKKRCKQKIDIPAHLFGTLDVTTTAWCLFDSGKKKYLGFREECKREVASLTKIMTVLVSIQMLEALQLMDLKVRVTDVASSMIGTTACLKAGHWMNIKDLLYGAMLPSGNDAAYSLAQYIGYLLTNDFFTNNTSKNELKLDLTRQSTKPYFQFFLNTMNQKVRSLSLQNTYFSNPHGLQNVLNTSSPKDMIKLSRYAMKNKLFREIVNTKEYSYTIEENGQKYICDKKWMNTNRLLGKGWQGVKTGVTAAAGNCLASFKEGVFIVVLNCQNDAARFSDTEKIWNWYQEHLSERMTKSVLTIRTPIEQRRKATVTKTEGSI